MKPLNKSVRIPLPPPDVRATQMAEFNKAMLKQGMEKVKELQETPDIRGAILTMLESIGVVWKNVPTTDTDNRVRLQSLAVLAFEQAGKEVPGPKSARRMVDRMVELVDQDWAKRGL